MSKFYLNGMDEEFCNNLNKIIHPNQHVYIVGWRPDSSLQSYDFFSNLNCNITLIEIFKPNADQFPTQKYSKVKVIWDDIQNFQQHINPYQNNLLYWGEGPEHLPLEVSKKLLTEMKKYFNVIIIHTPYGKYEQEEMYGNIYEKHLSTWFEDSYQELEFTYTKFHGPKHNFDAIIGYWKNNKV